MKTLREIQKFCRSKCSHTDCRGKALKRANRDHTFFGMIITPKGEYYCDYSPGGGVGNSLRPGNGTQ